MKNASGVHFLSNQWSKRVYVRIVFSLWCFVAITQRSVGQSESASLLGLSEAMPSPYKTPYNNLPSKPKPRLGLMVGFGNQGKLPVEYRYEVLLLQFQYQKELLPKAEAWGLALVLQPQYNLTTLRKVDAVPTLSNGFELGLNVGLLVHKSILSDFLRVYILVSVGPHYVSDTPQRQAAGFIFSDNLFVGSNIKLYKRSYLDLRFGFRHISNAGLKRPNAGINNHIGSGGILVSI